MQKTKREPVKGKRAGTPGVGTQASLQVRLWAGGGPAEDEVPAGALAMVEDFLGVSPCEPVELGPNEARALFSDLVQAVNAGRRLQRMVRGYGKFADGAFGAALLLASCDEAVSEAEMYELRQKQALSLAQPGQMFVVGALCDKVRAIPGLQFKEIDGAFASEGDAKPRRAMLILPAAGEARSSPAEEMKTRLVESFAKSPGQEDRLDARKAAPLVLARVGSKAGSEAAGAGGVPAGKDNAKEVEAGMAAAGADKAAPRQSLWSRPQVRLASGCAVALVVLAAVALAMHGRSSSTKEVQVASTPASSVATPAVAAVAPAAAAHGGNPAPAKETDAGKGRKKADAAPVAPVAAPPAPARKPDAQANAEVAKREPEKPAPAPPAETQQPERAPSSGGISVTYSAEDIANLLARADRDSGDGKYDLAIKEYQSILSHDRGNQRAKDGLARAKRNKGDR
jgi:hypothetical protein